MRTFYERFGNFDNAPIVQQAGGKIGVTLFPKKLSRLKIFQRGYLYERQD